MLLKFGRNLPGGGIGEPDVEGRQDEKQAAEKKDGDDQDARRDEPNQEDGRWNLSGPLEIDCLICHSNDRSYDPEQRAEQIEKQNLAWAASVAAGLADVQGSVKLLPESFDPAAERKDDADPEERLPQLAYRRNRFVAGGKVFFDIVRRPTNNACYQCHSVQVADHHDGSSLHGATDVHIAAGLSCADCHGNELEHHTVRGFPGEQNPSGSSVATLSCRGCHLGAGVGPEAGGHFAAPRPKHKGLPPLHFEKLTCTACHSGPWPGHAPKNMQTSLAHQLGVPGHRHEDDPPQIVAPVFRQDDEGKIAPYRQVWPAFWGVMSEAEIRPMNPDQVYKKLRRTLRVRRDFREEVVRVRLSSEEKAGVLGEARAKVAEAEWTDAEREKIEELIRSKRSAGLREKLAAALQALAKDDLSGRPVYVSAGKVYLLDESEELTTIEHTAAEPYAWPLAHDVRPAAQALGMTGCTDCHQEGAAIFYGNVLSLGQAPEAASRATSMYELEGLDPRLLQYWNQVFAGRKWFKLFGFVSVLITVLAGLKWWSIPGRLCAQAQASGRPQTAFLNRALSVLLFVALTQLSWTALYGVYGPGHLEGFYLFFHMAGSGLFLAVLPLWSITLYSYEAVGAAVTGGVEVPAHVRVGCGLRRICVAAFLLSALVVAGTMLLSMLPLFGTEGLEELLVVHKYSGAVAAISFLLYLAVLGVFCRRKRE